MTTQAMPPPHSRASNGGEDKKNNLPAVLFAENSYGRPFSVSER
jgi:hypothetical protein